MIIEADKTTFDNHIKVAAVADFFTTGCPVCEKLAPVFDQVAQSRSDIPFLKVNLDDDITLAERYSLSHVPTVILFQNGAAIRSRTGFMNAKELERFIDGEEADI